MQSQYGVPEIQQFMVEGGYAPLFSIPTPDTHSPSQPQKHHLHAHQPQQQQQQHHHHHLQQPQQQHPHHHHHHHHGQHLHLHHHHPPQLQVMPGQPQLQHFHTIPMTQQLFQQTHQFHLFQQEQESRMQQSHLGLDQPPGPVKVPPFLGPVNFKLAADESAGGGSRDGLKEEGGVQGDDGSESRLHPWSTAGEEESAIKEPFWRPLDVDYINRNNNNNKRCRERQLDPPNGGKHSKASTSRQGNDVEDGNNNNNNSANYKLFSELEAIYKPGGSSFGGGHRNTHHHTAPTSTPPTATAAAAEPGPDDDPVTETADQGSNASTAEEAAPAPMPDNKSTARKRKRKQQLSSMAGFLEGLVKRLMEHQEGLHRKFLELLERRDQEKTNREEAWRQQEAARASREATARAREQALASGREAAIISFLEKLTGECLNLPTKAEFQSQLQEEAAMAPHMGTDTTAPVVANSSVRGLVNSSSSRWPKAEVQALIRVRSGLEWRFQEPGLKGPLWEEVSSAMAAVGYHRSSKRCKEKWENINKYFRKSKGNAKKRPQHSKTCPYFHQLDQLYSGPLCPGRRDGQAAPNAIAVSDGQSAAAALDDDENNDGGEEEEEEEEEEEGGEEGEEEVGGEGERPEHTGGV